mgnify:CR=1 FL=1
MSTEPTTPDEPLERIRFRPFAARRARKAAAAAVAVEQRAWWHQRWSDSVADFRQRTKDRVTVSRARIEADRNAGITHVRGPGSKTMAPCDVGPDGVVPKPEAWLHRTGDETRLVNGRWVAAPYRSPARAAKLAKAGRLRPDVDDAMLREGLAKLRRTR